MALRRTLVVTQFYGRIKGGHLGAKKAYESMYLRRYIRYQNLSIAYWNTFF